MSQNLESSSVGPAALGSIWLHEALCLCRDAAWLAATTRMCAADLVGTPGIVLLHGARLSGRAV